MKIKIILLLIAFLSLVTVLYLVEEKRIESMEQKAFVLTELGCLKTDDTITEFDNRQILMEKINLPVYQRCK